MRQKISGILVIAVIVAMASCKKGPPPCSSAVYTGAKVSADSVSDYDGNKYSIVTIGSQRWLQQNLKSTHYRNGAPIIQGGDSLFASDSLKGLDSVSWANIFNYGSNGTQQPAWCYYNGDSIYNPVFGKLYNYYAVVSPNQLCPVGFHVPSDAEWHALVLTLDGCAGVGDPESFTAGRQLKSITLWTTLDTTASNSSKFTAYPAGFADPTRTYSGMDSLSYFWTATLDYSYSAWNRKLNSADSSVHRFNGARENGFSVRCVGN